MKKKQILSLILLILALLIPYLNTVSKSKARSILAKHLEKRYGEPFYIGPMGARSSTEERRWFEANIIPKRYLGTPKENDEYYWSVGTVGIHKKWWGKKLGTGGDVYMTVRLNESAAEFYKPKLDELFGDKYLPVFKIHTRYIKENGNFEVTARENIAIGASFYVEGHIYIFGQINSDNERDTYKNKIFEFITHMKETKTYEYTNLWFIVVDERVLSKEFQEDYELRNELMKIGEENRKDNLEYFRVERKKLMSRLPGQLTYEISITDLNRRGMLNIANWSFENDLFSLGIRSEKYLESRYLEKEKFLEKNEMYLYIIEGNY